MRIQTRIREREKSQKECFCTVLFSPPVAVRIDVCASYALSGFILNCVAAGVTSLPILASLMLHKYPHDIYVHLASLPFCKFRCISRDIFKYLRSDITNSLDFLNVCCCEYSVIIP